MIGEDTEPAGTSTVTKPLEDHSFTSSLPVIRTLSGQGRTAGPRQLLYRLLTVLERTPEATRPASDPPRRTIGKIAKIAKSNIVETLGLRLELAI